MQCNATQRNAHQCVSAALAAPFTSLGLYFYSFVIIGVGTSRPVTPQHNTTQHNYTLHDITRHITPHHNTSRHAAWRWVFSCFGVSVRSFACLFVRWSLSVSSQSFVLFVSHRVYPLWPWLFLPSVFLFTYVGRATFSFAL